MDFMTHDEHLRFQLLKLAVDSKMVAGPSAPARVVNLLAAAVSPPPPPPRPSPPADSGA